MYYKHEIPNYDLLTVITVTIITTITNPSSSTEILDHDLLAVTVIKTHPLLILHIIILIIINITIIIIITIITIIITIIIITIITIIIIIITIIITIIIITINPSSSSPSSSSSSPSSSSPSSSPSTHQHLMPSRGREARSHRCSSRSRNGIAPRRPGTANSDPPGRQPPHRSTQGLRRMPGMLKKGSVVKFKKWMGETKVLEMWKEQLSIKK